MAALPMAALPSSSFTIFAAKSLTPISSSSLFLDAYRSFASVVAASSPSSSSAPLSFHLLSGGSPLPAVPSDIPVPKIIPRTRFVVDGFHAAGDFSISYFLSHFHSDHYAGLGPAWCRGIVFCSPTTARLLVDILKVPHFFIVSFPLGEWVEVDGWEVAAVDANHCPGAIQFLFRVAGNGKKERYVHTGDFRYHETMKLDPFLRDFIGADAVFLDTTYCNPKYVFPSQEESVDYVVSTIQRIKDEHKESGESILFLIATYLIGKEKILLEIARRCGCLLHVDSRKMGVLSILGYGDTAVFTEDASASNIHVVGWNILGETWPFFRPNFTKIKEIMLEKGYSRAVGFVSTGWMYETKRDGFAVRFKDSLQIHLVPYSEHSNYDELREYIRFLKPKSVVPTVGMDIEKSDSKQALALQKHFAALVDKMAIKQDFLLVFHQKLASVRAENDNVVDPSQQEAVDTIDKSQVRPIEESSSQNSDALDMDETVKELRICLPSWVTHEQISDLVKVANGDIVRAVSDFFEHETEFYKQANACELLDCSSQKSDNAEHVILPASKSTQDVFDSALKNVVQQSKNLMHSTPNRNIFPLPKKRGSSTVSKRKKKGKTCSTALPTGSKQQTITKFFGTVASSAPSGGISLAINSNQDSNNMKEGQAPALEANDEKLNQFLQIINDAMPRNSAASLLQRANGNIDVAVDLFYDSVTHDVNTIAKEVKDHLSNDSSDKFCKTNLSTLYFQGSSGEDRNVITISLPIEKYLPYEHACWKAGQSAPYLHLARTFELVEREKGKIKTSVMLCNMFRSLLALSPADVLPAVYLCTNKIAADHENMELNIGGNLVVTALEESCGTSRSRIKEMYNSSGDLGDVAQEIRQTQSLLAPPRPLSILNLFSLLRSISLMTGTGSFARKKNLVVNLLRSCREMEIKFLVRTLVRNLRIGAMMKTILPALAQAVVLNSYRIEDMGVPETLKPKLQAISTEVAEAYNIVPNLDLLIPSLLREGMEFSASSLEMVPGVPIPPMLARITNGVSQVLKLFEGRALTCEYKYDGQRAQIHRLADGSIRIFSRQMKESTPRFPDLINTIKDLCKSDAGTFILDAEVVAVDRKNGNRIMSFQELSMRERGGKDSAVHLDSIKVDICVFLFDIMFVKGDRLLDIPLRQRRKYVKELFPVEKRGYLEFAREITVEADEACLNNQSTLARINSFFEDSCNSSCEGIMVKTMDVDAGYSASKRSEAWLKVKRDYVEGLGDSLDLVPIGAWYGNGRKAGWYSPFLMACYNPDTEEFQSVCRVMSGFLDSFYVEMKEFFSGEKLFAKKPAYYRTDETPDLWFSTELVWEIRGSDLTISPVHHAALGLVHSSRGISMRLPRYIRSLSDRKPEDCSTAADIACMYESQTRKIEVSREDQ